MCLKVFMNLFDTKGYSDISVLKIHVSREKIRERNYIREKNYISISLSFVSLSL